MNRFDNESRRTAEARNGNGGELGAAAHELSKIAVEETKRTTGLSQRAAYRKRLFEMRRGLNGNIAGIMHLLPAAFFAVRSEKCS